MKILYLLTILTWSQISHSTLLFADLRSDKEKEEAKQRRNKQALERLKRGPSPREKMLVLAEYKIVTRRLRETKYFWEKIPKYIELESPRDLDTRYKEITNWDVAVYEGEIVIYRSKYINPETDKPAAFHYTALHDSDTVDTRKLLRLLNKREKFRIFKE